MNVLLHSLITSFGLASSLAQIEPIESWVIEGPLEEQADLSAIAISGSALLVGSDEGTMVQVAVPQPADTTRFTVRPDLDMVMLQSKTELDIESIARVKDTNVYYVSGSHSLKRRLLEPDAPKENNLRSLQEIVFEPSRFHIFRIEVDPITHALKSKRSIGLFQVIARDPVLRRFAQIPSKENGIDIEGIASKGKDGNTLYLGFRSPVLRDNLVPIMVLPFDQPSDYKLIYIDLKGYGIRELVKVKKGFLIIAGPPGSATGPFYVYFWDGDDGIPDKGKRKSRLRLLGALPTPAGAKAEGMVVLKESDTQYDVAVVYDGITGGAPARFLITKQR